MNSTAQMTDNNFKKSGVTILLKRHKIKIRRNCIESTCSSMLDNNCQKIRFRHQKKIRCKGMYTIYNMNSTAQMTDNNLQKIRSGQKRK